MSFWKGFEKKALMRNVGKAMLDHPILTASGVAAIGGATGGYIHSGLDTKSFRILQSAHLKSKKLKAGTPEFEREKKNFKHRLAATMGISMGVGMAAGLAPHAASFRRGSHRGGHYDWHHAGGGYYGGGRAAAGKAARSAGDLHKVMGLSGSEKTKAEVSKHWKNLAKKHHPDAGGTHEKMHEINNAMDELKATSWFDKLAFFQGFKKAADRG